MSSNLADFENRIRRWAEERPKLAVRIARRRISLDALTSLVLLTPVDTGRARGGWNVTFDTPSDALTDKVDRQGSSTIAAGRSIINSAPTFGVIYIQNAVRYVRFLEEGTPRMAPFAMLERTLTRLQEIFA